MLEEQNIMTMQKWIDIADKLISFRDKKVFKNFVKGSHKQAIEKAEKESDNKFILIPKIKTEREEGEYYFDDFDLDTSKFNQKPLDF